MTRFSAILLFVFAAACGSEEPLEVGPDSGRVVMDAQPPDLGGEPADAGVEADSGQVDSGQVDSGQPDTGQADSGQVDSGEENDAGIEDAGAPDATTPDATPMNTRSGEIWLAEINDGQGSVFRTYAELVDESTAVYNVLTTDYVFPDSVCQLRRKVLQSGQPTDLGATSVEIDLNNMVTFSYLPTGNGRYEPQAAPSADIFVNAIDIRFEVITSMQQNTIDFAQVFSDPPEPLALISPLPGSPIFLMGGVALIWTPTTPPADRVTVVELYDDTRELRLTCELIGDPGSYFIPMNAVQDFSLQQVPGPLWVELRYEMRVTTAVGIIGTNDNVDLIFRTAQGYRWSAF